MKNKSKKRDIIRTILMVLALFMVFGVGLYMWGRLHRKSDEPTNVAKVTDEIKKFNYSLNDNVTAYYKTEFDKLKDMVDNGEITESDLASQIAKLYVIDLYSMSYKINKYEVTSAQYYYSSKQDMFKNKVIDNFYNLMEDNSYEDRKQELVEVSNVDITNTKQGTYKLDDKEVTSDIVDVNITYVKDLGYENKLEITLVHDGEANISVVASKAI